MNASKALVRALKCHPHPVAKVQELRKAAPLATIRAGMFVIELA